MALIVDKPIRKWEPEDLKEYPPYAEGQQQCATIRTDGERCPRMAMKGYEQCRNHLHWETRLPPLYGMPYPEDAVAIQEMLALALAHVLMERMSAEKARSIVLICTEMRRNLRDVQRELARQAIYDVRPLGRPV